jgi:hypothetical protein
MDSSTRQHLLKAISSFLSEALRKYQDVGFFLALYAAFVLRVYFAAFTAGTYDVLIWKQHVRSIMDQGIFNYYTMSLGTLLTFNHPPLMGILMMAMAKLCEIVKLDFKFIYRLVLGATDFLTAALLFNLLRRDRHPKIRVIVYLLAPVTFVLSSYHGNTDCVVSLFALASLGSLARGSYALAGFLLGLGISVKWIIVLACPALFYGIPTCRDKLRFALFGGLAIFVGYGWWVTQHPVIVLTSVFEYQGQMFFSGAGDPIWGNQIFLRPTMRLFGIDDADVQQLLDLLFRHNRTIILVPILTFSWLRRRRSSVKDIGATIAGTFCIFYAATNYWAYQYFAWAIPFYFFLDRKRGLLLILLTSAYIYASYSYFCGSLVLAGSWDFIGHQQWPFSILILRDVVMLFFMYIAIEFIIRAAMEYKASAKSHLIEVCVRNVTKSGNS